MARQVEAAMELWSSFRLHSLLYPTIDSFN